MNKRLLATVFSSAALAAGVSGLVTPGQAGASTVQAASLSVRQVWSVNIPDGGNPIAQSSPTVATLDGGGPAALVGDRAGHIYALHLSNGSEVAGWPASTGGVSVDSAPSSWGSTVFVGEGNAGDYTSGGYASFAANAELRWLHQPQKTPGDPAAAVDSGLTVGNLEGQIDVVSGSLAQYSEGLNAANGSPLFEFLQADSNFATPAIADLYGNGHNEIIEGGDSSHPPGPDFNDVFGQPYLDGGHVRVLTNTGAPVCEFDVGQVVQSSPAVGEFLAHSGVGITVGTGTFWSGHPGTNQLLGLNSRCQLQWATTLDGATSASPALVDALGGGSLQIAEGTSYNNDLSGSVYLLNGSNGGVIWRTPVLGGILGSVTSADFGEGYQDIVATTSGGVEILDGRTGQPVWSGLHGALAFQNSPLITRDANGTVGITVAGYNGAGSEVVHYEVADSPGSRVGAAGSWPMFHRDPQLTGDAGTPPPVVAVPCPPSTTPSGYWLAGANGAVFNFGNLPFCGSTANILLNHPIVGVAATPNAGGYWLVASDGGMFSFGNTHFYGSTGSIRLNRPIVSMAPTSDSRGYWLVASDGGIFAFGDARFYGSTGSIRLNRPIVSMAPTPDGRGYWLTASDGGIFAFGDARFYGSTGSLRLNRPIVTMAATSDGRGYWLAVSDGGMFAFGDAHFMGSTGGMRLVKPIVAMHTTRTANGYWLTASDGGVFGFGAAGFHGSTGATPLSAPIIGIRGY